MYPIIKNSIFLLLIFSGFLIFLSNSYNLNLSYKSSKLSDKINDHKIIEKKNKKPLAIIKDSNFLTNDLIEKEIKSKFKENIIKVKKGQTFSEILNTHNLENKKKFEIINLINEIFDLKTLKINQKIIFFKNKNNLVKKIIIELDYKTNLVINLEPQISVIKNNLKTYSTIESKDYTIINSLYADGINNNVPNPILIKLIKLFSFDIDFQRDIRKDTQVSVAYENNYVENKSDFSLGEIEYARIKIKNNSLEYFKFITDDGFVDYFNRDGKNVKKSILKTPLDGARLSSNFGMRKHPISGFNKMHKGIDFAAPKGTPVYAGGNGVIEIVGTNGGYGKYIRIRHNNEYKTAYAHLSGFNKGISKGVRVNQGDIIGFVGSTGRSTGPHLHYEIIYENKQINPLTLKLPSGKILKDEELERFKKNYKMILANHLNNLYE